MLALSQGGLPLDIKDYVYEKPLALADAPQGPHVVLKVFGLAGFDPASPWRLTLRLIREKGQFRPERATADFPIDVTLPAEWFQSPAGASPEDTGWRSMWHDRAGDLAVLGAALALLAAVLAWQPATMRRPTLVLGFRLGFMVFTLVVVGWLFQAQLSIVTLAGVVKAVLVTGDLGFLLWDPPSLVLWGVVLVSAVVWGRGTFCGWLCPFGAMQELLAEIPRRLRLRQWRVPPGLDRRLRGLKYLVLLAFLAIVVLWPAAAEVAAEVEPFKTAITVVFLREWPAVAWAVVLLAVNLVVYKGFCRYLCPLGAFVAILGLARRFDWIARRVECGSPCRLCERRCRYGAISASGRIDYVECFQCMDCVVIHEDRRTCVPLVLDDRRMARAKEQTP
ncbi:4Fe-4S binding protein [Oleomonas cavernae]|uniref:4Fe-4S binding protein n=1 Tax=Oleomonas cavernae TaxID=2320859 RepID=A0A418WER5_9PROT|nr:4Fe-4S binding protein [Oleomonas cavernae]RJF88497.1 4Fe-4S binding protein [Oleomonas cavernae]